MSFFPFPSAPLMITAGKLPLVAIDYRRSTSSDIHINLFRIRVYSTEKRSKMPGGASSSLETGNSLSDKPYNIHRRHICTKYFSSSTQTLHRFTSLSCQPFSLLNIRHGQFCYLMCCKNSQILTKWPKCVYAKLN